MMTVALVLAANRPINALTLILIKQIPPARQGVTFRWLTVSSWQVSKRQDLTPFLPRAYRGLW